MKKQEENSKYKKNKEKQKKDEKPETIGRTNPS